MIIQSLRFKIFLLAFVPVFAITILTKSGIRPPEFIETLKSTLFAPKVQAVVYETIDVK